MAPQYVFTMKGLGKVHPPDTVVLKDIWLSFLPGAKIGVLGLNGAGKSTLLQIMAGVETRTSAARRFPGEGVSDRLPAAGAAARSREGREGQRRGGRRVDPRAARPLRRRQHEARRGPVARGDGQGPRRAVEAAGPDRRRRTPGISTRGSSWRWTRCACRRGDADVGDAVGRRAPPRRAVPAAAAVARPAAARRADQPPRRRVGGLARALPQGLSRAPSSRSRTIATSSTTSPAGFSSSIAAPGIPYEGNYTGWLEQKQAAPRAARRRPRSKRQRTLQRELDWIRMSPRARQAKGKARLNAYEQLLAEDTRAEDRRGRNLHSARPASRRHRRRGAQPAEGVRRSRAVRRSQLHAAARRHRRRDRPERRRQDDDVPADHGAGAAGRRHAAARRDGADRLRRPVARRARPEQDVWEEISGGEDELEMGKRTVRVARLRLVVQLQGRRRSSARSASLSGGERNRVHLAKLLRTGCNLLLLDEPTNDLDVDTLRALEEALLNFAGCAVVISHDRWFLDRIATHILAFEGDSRGGVVRGQLPGLRSRPQAPPRRRSRPAAPHQVPGS